MMYVRYRMAAELAPGGAVLEVGCGSGMGLPYLRAHASIAVGGDYTMGLVREARGNVPGAMLMRMDAQHLPFAQASFDVALMLEMVYYIPDLDAAVAECRRVLKPQGRLMISVPNPDRPDFNPSPFSLHYPNLGELSAMLRRHGFTVTTYGGFPVEPANAREHVLAPLRHFAVRYHLIPRSMRAKSILKRLLYGKLPNLGAVRDGVVPYAAPTRLAEGTERTPGFKTLYAVGVAAP